MAVQVKVVLSCEPGGNLVPGHSFFSLAVACKVSRLVGDWQLPMIEVLSSDCSG